MKKITFFSLFLFLGTQLFAQVGIGNTDPKSTLDISATNVATPNNTDGILIPRMDDFPVTNPTIDQDGMMVFATGNGSPLKGFYYWDQGTTAWVSVGGGVDTQNTLDEAYDEGGAGLGRTIVADNGALSIQGNDGIEVTGTFGSGATIGTSGAGTRMFFNPRKAAFRAGNVTSTQWNDANVGDYSVAMGRATTASGIYDVAIGFSSLATGTYSTALGWANRAAGAYSVSIGQNSFATGWSSTALGRVSTASGSQSMVFGHDSSITGTRAIGIGNYLESPSGYEITMGHYNTLYTPNSTAGIDPSDRLFSIGNGTSGAARSNALTIFKDGTFNINDSYNMPMADGTAGQVMTTDGAGQLSFSNASGDDADWYEENTTSPPTSNSADIFTDGNVGIGLSNVLYPLQIESPASSRTISLLNENTGTSVTGIYNNIDESVASASGSANGIVNSITRSNQSSISGVSNSFQNSVVNSGFAYLFGYQNSFGTSTSNTTFALINRFQGTTGTAYGTSNLIGGPITNFYGVDNHNIAGANLSGTFYGIYNSLTGSDSGDRYGVYTSFAETGSGNKYGEYIIIATSAGGTHYGVYSDVQNGTGYAGYFLGRTSLGNATTNRYLMPAVDGTAGQVMTTDGAGNVTFQTPATGAERINDLIDGKSDFDGTNNGSSVFLGINAGAADDSSDNKNVGIGWNAMQNTSTGIENIAIGNRALQTNTVGGGNIAIGHQSLLNNTNADSNVAVGGYSLRDNTTGDQNTAVGSGALIDNETGNANVALGYQANYEMISNNSNTGIGYQALMRTQGNSNTALGREAGEYADGNNNVLLGERAGSAVTTISRTGSIMIGYEAGYGNTGNNKLYIENSAANADNALIYGEFDNNILRTNSEFQIGNPTGTGYAFPTVDGTNGQVMTTDGAGNITFATPTTGAEKIDDLTDGKSDSDGTDDGSSVFLGLGAGQNDDSTNNYNVGVGYQSTITNTSGHSNSALGYQSLFDNTTGDYNVAIGHQSLYDNSSGDYNVAIGRRSLYNNEIGSYNTAIGYETLYSATNFANFNVALGGAAGYSNSSGSYNVFIGYNAGYNETGGHKLYIESTNADANNALIYGEFDNDIIRVNGELQVDDPTGTGYAFPTADGTAGQVIQTDGAGNLSWTTSSGEATTASNGLTETGDDVRLGGTLSQFTTIDQGNNNLRFDLTGTGDFIVLDNGTIEFIVEDTGDVGIGTNNPNYQLDVNESDNTKAIGVNIQKTDNTSTLNTAAMSVTKTASGTGSSSVITTFADGTGSGEQRGIYNILNGTGTGNKYGVKNELTSASNGLQYGMENNFSGGTSSVRYAIRNNFTAGTGTQLGMYNSFANNSTGSDTGISNFFSGTNAAAKTGLSNIFAIASAGDQTGIINSFGSSSNTNKVGGYTSFSSTTGGTMYGFQVDVTATGATSKYGVYVDFDTAVTGTNNYGVYSIVDNTDGWSGYFEGKNYVSDAIGINNPAPDGRLDIIHNSTGSASPHIMLTAQNANAGTRITFDNAVETANNWVLFARADDAVNGGTFNIFSSEAGTNVVRLDSDGKMGIMRNPATNTLEVEGDASKTTAGSWIANSDRRLKKNIKSIAGETALDKIEKMRGVTYLWNDDKTGIKRPEGIQYGFVAQELMEIFPEKVTKDNLGFYQTAYGDYDPIFVEAIKELKTEVDSLKDENQKLKEKLSKFENIEARLSALEKDNSSETAKFSEEK